MLAPKPRASFSVRISLASAVAAAALLAPIAATAQQVQRQGQDWDGCLNAEEKFSVDQRTNSCTAIIQSGKETLANLALAYNNRGMTYNGTGEYDRAIADYSEAIRLNPKDPAAYNNRGNAYSRKGEYDRAIADLNEAIRLDPKRANP